MVLPVKAGKVGPAGQTWWLLPATYAHLLPLRMAARAPSAFLRSCSRCCSSFMLWGCSRRHSFRASTAACHKQR
jgi:hypothetical protein